MSDISSKVIRKARGYQYVLADKGTINLADMSREELMVALMESIDPMESVARYIGNAQKTIEDWAG